MILDEERCWRAISEAFPALELQSVRYFAAGWDYELWEANSDLLFRFPLREDCATRLPVEARLLHELAKHVSVAIPRPEYVSTGVPAHEWPFFAYRKLPGVALDVAQLNPDQLTSVALKLSQFLSELHSFPVERAVALRVPERTGERWRQRYLNLRPRVEQDVYPLLTRREIEQLGAFWQDFVARDDLSSFAPALIHGDLAPEHVLIDASGLVSAVIDFGDVLIGDPALDFAGFDRPLRDLVVSHYHGDADATLPDRANIYRTVISPFNYVLFGQDQGEQSLIDESLQRLHRTLHESRQ